MNTNIAPRLSYPGYDGNLTGLHANDEVVVTVERDLGGLKSIWRDLERRAVGHVYQSYNWVSLWHGTVGRRDAVSPYIAVGRAGDGRALFLLPLGLCRTGG